MKLVINKWISFLIVIMLMVAGCTAGEEDTKKESIEPVIPTKAKITTAYFPTKPGLYKKFVYSGGGTEEQTVLEPREFQGKEVLPIEVKRSGGSHPEEQGEEIELTKYTNFYIVTTDEVQMVGMETEIQPGEEYSDSIDPPWITLMFGKEKGNEWSYEILNPPGVLKVTVLGFEEVTTKVGTFENVVKLKMDCEYLNQAGETEQATYYEWYAPEVGLIKIDGDNGAEDGELVELKNN